MPMRLRPGRGPSRSAGWAKLDWKTRLHFFETGQTTSLCGRTQFDDEYCTEFYTPRIVVKKIRLCRQCLRKLRQTQEATLPKQDRRLPKREPTRVREAHETGSHSNNPLHPQTTTLVDNPEANKA
jgi:hypothetical protein